MSIWPSLAFDPEESLLSYADRLSVLHTGRGMGRLVKDFGINTEHFTSGREEAVLAFAEAAGLQVEDAKRASVRVFPRGASFRGEPISKAFLSPRAARYCPACLDEDDPGTTVLGVEITERRFHTLYSLSSAVGIERPRLSRLLKKLGEIPADSTEVETGNMVFEVDKTVPLIEAFKTAIPLRDVPDYLGASKRQVEILYRAGIIQPLVPRTERGAVRNVVFGRTQLDDLLKRISDLPILDQTNAEKFHPISYACQRGAGRFEDIFIDILEGLTSGFCRSEKSGVSAIHVDVRSLVAIRKSA